MTIRFLIALAVLPLASYAQKGGTSPQANSTVMRARAFSMFDALNFPEEEKIDGTPYLNDEYHYGVVITKDGRFKDIPMRYNIYFDQIEFKDKETVYALKPDDFVSKASVGGTIFIVDQLEVKGQPQTGYFVRLDSGKATLLFRPAVLFKPRQEAKPLETDPKPAKFVRLHDTYYAKLQSGKVERFSSIKDLIGLLPDKKKDMEAFAKANKISAKDEKDLLSFFKHYNSL